MIDWGDGQRPGSVDTLCRTPLRVLPPWNSQRRSYFSTDSAHGHTSRPGSARQPPPARASNLPRRARPAPAAFRSARATSRAARPAPAAFRSAPAPFPRRGGAPATEHEQPPRRPARRRAPVASRACAPPCASGLPGLRRRAPVASRACGAVRQSSPAPAPPRHGEARRAPRASDQSTASGRLVSPRSVRLSRRVGAPASCIAGKRWASAGRAIWASRRARGAPRQ